MNRSFLLDKNGCFIASISAIEGIRLLAREQSLVPILDLRGIPCPRIPKEIALIQGLEELYLDENSLQELPEEIGHIEKLRILSLGRNSIVRLPSSLVERWATLQKLFLGDNRITELSFTEDDLWAFQHGSIGTNPLPEPINKCWMMREDALKIPEIMKMLVPENLPPDIAKTFADMAIHIFAQAGEPMIFEILFDGVVIQEDGEVRWNEHFDRPWLQYVAIALIPSIVRGSLVDRSLWAWNVRQIKVKELPEIPTEIEQFAVSLLLS